MKTMLILFLTLMTTSAQAFCLWDCNRYKTKHPIVLVHGVSGFDSILGVDYFYDVAKELKSRGGQVYTVNVSAWNTPEHRGQDLIPQLEALRARTGAQKFNLVGHSLGGPTSRYVAAVRPDLVASVTSVNGVHGGSAFANWGAQSFPPGTWGHTLLTSAINGLGTVIDLLSGNAKAKQDAWNSVVSMTTANAEVFNKRYPAGRPTSACGQGASSVNGIRYYAWGGNRVMSTTDYFDGSILNASNVLLSVTALAFGNEKNDGLVGQCNQHWGNTIRSDYALNHLEAINHFFGWHGFLSMFKVNPVDLYKNHAERLKNVGL
uniref:Lipase n=1 Tax=uncultured microorganism TaxID=358574 RepID=A0A0B4ZTU9_9ZZZZ|nr:lipase [uncultured microorganism]